MHGYRRLQYRVNKPELCSDGGYGVVEDWESAFVDVTCFDRLVPPARRTGADIYRTARPDLDIFPSLSRYTIPLALYRLHPRLRS